MSNVFNSVKGLHPKRNKFTADTYRNDFTAPLGVNIPCFCAEVPPATRYKVSTSALVRLQALIAPVMDNIDYYVHFWKVPYRLLENDRFTKFISGEITAEEYDALFLTPTELAQALYTQMEYDYDNTDPDFKVLYDSIFGNGSLLDFLGYDVGLFPALELTADTGVYDLVIGSGNNSTKLNWRGLICYFMIHQNWYMNENVEYFPEFLANIDELVNEQTAESLVKLLIGSSVMNGAFSSMLPHAWDKDYFTSALPNVQFGDPVTLPVVGNAPVTIPSSTPENLQAVLLKSASDASGIALQASENIDAGTFDALSIYNQGLVDSPNGSLFSENKEAFITRLSGFLGSQLKGTADLSEATAISINELRFANALQVFKERQMRFGRRRLEYYKGFFDVEPEDLRLQVPKYLGGGRIPINIADIEQTSSTTGSKALGSLAGKGTAVAGGFAGFSTFCSEETFIIGISFAMPHITYAQQLSRFKMKTNDYYDYFNPSFEHLGEQAIKNIEIFAGTDNPDGEFGYTPRYNEYRFHSNEMHGAFKDSLSFWTLGRIFDDTPALNAQFVYMQPKVFDRIFAVSGQPNMLVSMLFHTRAIKPVSKYGTPMLLA